MLGFKSISEQEEAKFSEFIDASYIISLNEEIVINTINIRRRFKIKLPDAIIAATAIVNDLIIVTRNTKDFEKIEALEVLNPHEV